VGGIVGHETHPRFDDEGRQFDGNGNLADWWTAEDAKHFEEKADCEVKEYSNFVAVDDVKVNGKLTTRREHRRQRRPPSAYIAFWGMRREKTSTWRKSRTATLRCSNFLGHGQSWCGNTRPQQLRLQVQTDPHSPRQFRANGVVQNMPEFGQAFDCKAGQPMMPVNACRCGEIALRAIKCFVNDPRGIRRVAPGALFSTFLS